MKEATTFDVKVKHWKLEKFDGEHVEGDGKEPIEYIEGGDGLPTKHFVRTGDTYSAID
jgi:phage/plasmid primase-like uncharacterized protein